MRNPIDIDHANSRAIWQEIGERFQQYLRAVPELPASIRRQVGRLEAPGPSIVPDAEPRLGRRAKRGREL
jgi:hypothetical protein